LKLGGRPPPSLGLGRCRNVSVVPTELLLTKARDGDGDAFRELTDPYRRELQVHCYRMLGSLEDAEDALQDALLAAWQGLSGFQELASIRTWLYQIATNRCLNALRSAKRRPAKEWDIPGVEPPAPSALGDVPWLEPYPDALLGGVVETLPAPHARYEQAEAISLAFVTALQLLPSYQRAVLILRDVLGYHAKEVAKMLGSSVESVNSALKRARATIRHHHPAIDRKASAAPNSPAGQALVTSFVRAFQAGDVDGIVKLLTADVRLAMPPIPLEYHGIDAVTHFYRVLMGSGRRYHLVPTRANGQLAFGTYVRSPHDGVLHGMGLVVVTLSGDHICDIVRFESNVLPWFGLPRTI